MEDPIDPPRAHRHVRSSSTPPKVKKWLGYKCGSQVWGASPHSHYALSQDSVVPAHAEALVDRIFSDFELGLAGVSRAESMMSHLVQMN